MSTSTDFLAVDLGASGGRVMLGRWNGARLDMEELHRFANGPVTVHGRLHWNHLQLWSEIKTGLSKYIVRAHSPLASIGVDTWGVDYALLDASGRLLGNPYHYRDPATDDILARAFAIVPREHIYEVTGIQTMQINTIYQLLARRLVDDPQLALAETLLMTPDLFHYWLTGRKVAEYSIASTSQMLDARRRAWATDLLARFDLPVHILPEIVQPGTVLGALLPEVCAETGLDSATRVVATGAHDTASAVAAVPDLDARSLYISSGTWSLMGVEVAEPVIDDVSMSFDFTNEGGVAGAIRLLKNVAGLWLLQESRRQWQREGKDYGWDELIALAARAAPLRSIIDPDDPTYASPGDIPALIRAACARTGQPLPEDVGATVRCILESLALKYRSVLEKLERLAGHRLDTIRIVGGGTQNRLLNQFTADACDRAVVCGPIEATALGNVMMQAIATGHLQDVAEGREVIAHSTSRHSYEPQPGHAWQEAYERMSSVWLTG